MSLKEAILSAIPPVIADVCAGQPVLIRRLTGAQRSTYSQSNYNGNEFIAEGFKSRLLALTMTDPETGQPVFAADEANAIEAALPYDEIDRLYAVAAKHNGIGTEDDDRKN